jgi:hypothetical protein
MVPSSLTEPTYADAVESVKVARRRCGVAFWVVATRISARPLAHVSQR